jgi:hypothetical protein
MEPIFFGASSVASALGIRCRRDPTAESGCARQPVPEPDCNRGRCSGRSGPGLQQARQRGASPRRTLVSLGHLLIPASESKSPAAILDIPAWGATPRRSVSDYERRKQPARSVTFLRDSTIPISVTSLNDLTGVTERMDRVCTSLNDEPDAFGLAAARRIFQNVMRALNWTLRGALLCVVT